MADDQKERRSDYLLLGEMSADIKTIGERTLRMEKKVDKHSEDLAALNVKAGVWGALSGFAVVIPLYVKHFMARGGH